MVLDVLNNLLLIVDPNQRSRTENYLRIKYQMLLSNLEDQRKPVAQLQSQIRYGWKCKLIALLMAIGKLLTKSGSKEGDCSRCSRPPEMREKCL